MNNNDKPYDEESYWKYLIQIAEEIEEEKELEVTDKDGECSRSHP